MFVIEVPYINLDHIYDSGQAPRWIKLKEGKYVVPFKNKALKIEQQKNKYDLTKCRLIMNCSEEDFYNIWFEYFDLKTDYVFENFKIKKLGKKFKVIANRGYGIHTLNQDPFEAYLYCRMVSNVGYINASIAINHIAEICGVYHCQSMREAGKIVWYEFPTPEMIIKNFNKLMKMGKINTWLKKLCEAIINNGFDFTKSDNELFRLFAMHDIDAFPNVEIENVLKKNFDCDTTEFVEWYLDNVENKGLVYLYILHHIRNKPKEII